MPLCLGTRLGGVVLDQTEWVEPGLHGIRLCIAQDSVCYETCSYGIRGILTSVWIVVHVYAVYGLSSYGCISL